MAAHGERRARAGRAKRRSGGEAALEGAELDRICLYNLLSTSLDLIYFKDLQSRFLRASRSSAAFTGAGEPDEMIGTTDADYFTRDKAERTLACEQRIMRSGRAETDQNEHEPAGPSPYEWLSTTKQPLRDLDGTIIGTYGISRDITGRVAVEQRLKARTAELDRVSRELHTVLDSSPDSMARFDRDLRCTYANPAAVKMTGEEMVGRTVRDGGHPDELVHNWENALRQALDTGQDVEFEHRMVVAGSPRFLDTRLVPEADEHGEVVSVLAVSRDLTDRRRLEEALAEQATHDPLTGLANRTLLIQRIDRALGAIAAGSKGVAVLFIDLDRFKEINDNLGHAIGDALLVKVAERLREAARGHDIVARLGGDEFVILCEDAQQHEAARIAQRLGVILDSPADLGGHTLRIGASIGIAATTHPDASADALLREADAAMYRIKSATHGEDDPHGDAG